DDCKVKKDNNVKDDDCKVKKDNNVKDDDCKVKKDNNVNEIDKIEVNGDVYDKCYSDYEKYDDIEAVGSKNDQNDDINDENHSDVEEYSNYEEEYSNHEEEYSNYEEEYNDDNVNEIYNDYEEENNNDDVSEDNDEEEFRYDSYEFILSFLNRYGDYVSEIDIKNKFMEADSIIKTMESVTSQHEYTEKTINTDDLFILH
ncbi:17012_t:CDS:1, partial [Gigaspora rosea]